jgi:hypothetical protein
VTVRARYRATPPRAYGCGIPLASDHREDRIERGSAAAITPITAALTPKEYTVAYRTDAPLIKSRPQTPTTTEREQLLEKIAGCSDRTLLTGYQERLRQLPATGPEGMPRDAREATNAMIEVLQARADATNDRQRALGYQNRVRDLRAWFDQPRP